MDNGNLFLIRSPIESIRDSVKLSNQFLAYVGFIATVISAALIWFVTTRITRPIMELKNISEQPLNISADELTERFIRGDVSRSTEGSGLGLSIAKSLVERQNGTLDLYLDGDLFKATISFDLARPKAGEESNS